MKISFAHRLLVAALGSLLVSIQPVLAQGTTFAYQGNLSTNGVPANGFFDFEFSLYTNATGSGTKVGSTITQTNLGVTNGLFITALDFGDVFTGNDMWLAMSVRSDGGSSYTALTPLQELTPSPYAMFANTASNISGTLSAAQLSGTIPLARLPATLVTNDEGGVTLSNVTMSGNGSGLTNLSAAHISGTIPLGQLPAILSLFNDPGTQNFFAGQSAGNLTLSGSYNTGIGVNALSGVTSGNYNTGVGDGALLNNTTATNNTAIGYDAMLGPLFGITTGGGNTAVGSLADAFDSTGYNNTACGINALALNTTGYLDTAVGSYALGGGSGVITGGGDTGLGASTLYNLTTGYNNTAAGNQALYADSTGVDNVGIGVATFQACSTGSANTGVGTYAFQLMTAGTGNIGLGYHAGYYLAAGTNNIYIGNEGAPGDNEIIRIGDGQTETYLAGTATYIGGTVTCAGLICNPITCCSITITGGCDLAEPFPISTADRNVTEGAVVVIDDKNPGQLKLSDQPYDPHVAGVVSGANGIQPGIQMQQQGLLEGGKNVALTGRVYVQADTSNGSIKPGDLLTTSSAPGRAMRVSDHLRAQGAILGKAMSGLSAGNGMVLVLVTLQ